VAQERALPTSAQSSTNAETERAVVRQYSDKGWCDNSLTAGSTAVAKTSHVLRFSQLSIAAWGAGCILSRPMSSRSFANNRLLKTRLAGQRLPFDDGERRCLARDVRKLRRA
jgi:hypothetical protein